MFQCSYAHKSQWVECHCWPGYPCRCRTCYRLVSYQAVRPATRRTSHSTRCYVFFRCTTYIYKHIRTYVYVCSLCTELQAMHVCMHFQCTVGFLCCTPSSCLCHTDTRGPCWLAVCVDIVQPWSDSHTLCLHALPPRPFPQLSHCLSITSLYSLSNPFVLLSWYRCVCTCTTCNF